MDINSNNTQLLNQNSVNVQKFNDEERNQNISIHEATITFADGTSSYHNPFQYITHQVNQRTGGFQGKKKQKAKPLYVNAAKAFIKREIQRNAQRQITTALQKDDTKTFSGLDKTIVDGVIAQKNTNNAKDVNILQNSNQIATSKKPRQPISFKDENAMNAAIKKQKNAL